VWVGGLVCGWPAVLGQRFAEEVSDEQDGRKHNQTAERTQPNPSSSGISMRLLNRLLLIC